MSLKPHSKAWYDRLAGMQAGYYYPWRSKWLPLNGEDTYLEVVRAHLSPNLDVLDIACGHGQVPLEIAPFCRSVLAYDRVSAYIALAQQATREQGIENVTFRCADSSAEANEGQPRIPAGDHSLDLLISRRGPLHWIADVRRVARPGATLIQLNPHSFSAPPWLEALPESLRFEVYPYGGMRESVGRRLAEVGLIFHSTWTFERPEYFDDVEQVYRMLAWGSTPDEVPALAEVRPTLEAIFAGHAGPAGLAVPRGRFLWLAVVPA